ncbi:MAG: FAD-dependent monooxygenase [Mariprofundus sp.]|nr:FAD-dependent monooxygenase [Mariprofundus sp.]
MVKSDTFDVVIVGGGAVGVTLALQLEQLDYRVAVVELVRPSFSSSEPERVIALNYGSRAHLEKIGLWKQLETSGVGNIRNIVVSEAGNRGRASLKVSELPELSDFGYVVEMGLLLEPMYQALQASSVTIFSPATVETLFNGDKGVDIKLRLGDSEQWLHAALLVGADGTNSQIRRMAKIAVCGWDYNRFGVVASVTCSQRHVDVAYECFRHAGPLAFLPLADGRFSIVWAVTPAEASQLMAMDDECFLSTLRRAVGTQVLQQLDSFTAVSKRALFPLELTIAKKYTVGRIALVGNAAHTIHPVAGQGMNLGLRDVDDLVAVLDSPLGRTDPGQKIVLQAYSEKRRADVLAVVGFTESMLHTFASRLPVLKWLRGWGLDKLVSMPKLKALLLRQASGLAQLGGRNE